MFECRTFITVKEIGEVLGVSESKSYGIVRDLNKDLVMRDITPRDVLAWQNEMRKREIALREPILERCRQNYQLFSTMLLSIISCQRIQQ